jgi:hypothetical protein
LSDRDLISTGEFVVYPHEGPSEVIETTLTVPADGEASGETAEPESDVISLTWNAAEDRSNELRRRHRLPTRRRARRP